MDSEVRENKKDELVTNLHMQLMDSEDSELLVEEKLQNYEDELNNMDDEEFEEEYQEIIGG